MNQLGKVALKVNDEGTTYVKIRFGILELETILFVVGLVHIDIRHLATCF